MVDGGRLYSFPFAPKHTYLDHDSIIRRVRHLVPREHHVRVPVQLHAHRIAQRVVLFLHDERSRVGNLGVSGERELPHALGKHELLSARRLVHGIRSTTSG